MHICIDTNTLIDSTPSEDIAGYIARPGAVDAVQRLAQHQSIVYYTVRPMGVEAWLEQQRFPSGAVVHYHSVLYKLVEVYEREHSAGSAVLIDADWRAVIEEFQKLAEGGHATRVSYWRHLTAFIFGYLRLFAFGGAEVPLSGPMPAVVHVAGWKNAEELLGRFYREAPRREP